jgi:hypothetical protein
VSFGLSLGQLSDLALERRFDLGFGTAANEKINVLVFPGTAGFAGVVDLTIAGTNIGADASGMLRTSTTIGLSPAGTLWASQSMCLQAAGKIVDHFAVMAAVWDAAAGAVKIPVAHLTTTANPVAVKARMIGASGETDAFAALAAGALYTTDATAPAKMTPGSPVIVSVPASKTAAGLPGQVSFDASYVYMCVATNTWIRVAKDAGW